MAKGPKLEFRIPETRGLGAKVPTKVKERNLARMKPTDKNQLPPTPEAPIRQHAKMAGD